MAGDVSLTKLSDAEISEEECNVFREKVKAGLLKKLTIMELEQKAEILHEDITKHNIAQELQLLQNRIDRANEKGWRDQLTQSLEKRHILQQPWYLSFKLLTNPVVIPEEVAPFKSEQEDGASCSGC
uniref:Putative ovule protein n=1 Tax=Solanum chacoense TaxID=4108 RepID=A0A0V0H9N8_SOLCH